MRKRLKWILPAGLSVALIAAFLIYTGRWYHSDEAALAALESDGAVKVVRTGYGWLFDGPSEDSALVFYPGGKVETTAYAPLLHALAAEGMDACLVDMPFHLALFGIDRATGVMDGHAYANWYVGGHSLGGVMAARYAAGHGDRLAGLILFAAYPTRPLEEHLVVISLYGSEDGVLNREKLAEGRACAPGAYHEVVIPGGNHAQFGNYGKQRGDGGATISAAEQQREAVEAIVAIIQPGDRGHVPLNESDGGA